MGVEQEGRQVGPREHSAEKLHAQQGIRKTPFMLAVEERSGRTIEDLFRHQYLGQRRSLQYIAVMIGRPWSTTYSWAHKLGITIRSLSEAVRASWADPEQRRSQRKYFEVRKALGAETDEDFGTYLTTLYLQEGSQKKMAERIKNEWGVNVSGTTMGTWMSHLGIEVKKRGVGRWLREEETRAAVKEAFASGAFSGLFDREQVVLNLRYFAGETLEKCGKEFGVTRERIRQIEADALRKLEIMR